YRVMDMIHYHLIFPLKANGIDRCDELEKLPDKMHGITDPAGTVFNSKGKKMNPNGLRWANFHYYIRSLFYFRSNGTSLTLLPKKPPSLFYKWHPPCSSYNNADREFLPQSIPCFVEWPIEFPLP